MPLKHSVEEIKLKNGARGLLINTPASTSVFYDVHFWAGIRYAADRKKSQVAHIMEHLSFGANSTYETPEAFSREFSKNGANNNAITSSLDMSYFVHAALMEWDRVFNLQLLAVTEPRYNEQTIEAEKGNVREELIGDAANHDRILWQEIMRHAHLDRWYDPEEITTIEAVGLKDIQAHFAKTHVSANMMFIIAGNLTPHKDAIIDKLEHINLEHGALLPLPKEVVQVDGPIFVKRKDLPTLTFSLTFFVNRRLNRDEERALDALCYTITDTLHSRIFGKARARGICYGMGSYYESSITGITELSIHGEVTFENAPELFKLIIDELNDIREHGITEEELQQSKEYRLGRIQLSNETVDSLVSWYRDEYYEVHAIDYLDDMPAQIAKTTTNDVQDILNEFFNANLWTLGGIGNSTPKKFAAYYELFAKNITNKTIQ